LAEALCFDPTHADSVKALQHPHLMNVRAIGTWQQWLYQVVDEPNGAQLQKLVEEIGPMPATLAAKYVLQASQAIQTAHQAGLLHDDIRPCHLQIGPLSPTSKTRPDGTPIRRPSSSASVRLCELAYGPHVRANPDPNAVPYLPPEYSPLTKPSSACDIYMLGAMLHFLLSGKPPADSAPLGSLRPDAPSPLVSLAKDMLHEIPESRPTIDVVIEMLTQIVDGKVKPKVEPPRIIDSAEVALTPAPEAEVKLEHAPLDHVPMDFIPEDSSHLTPNMQAGQEDWMAPDEFVPKAYEVSSVSSSQVGLGDKPTKPKEKAPPKPVMSRERMYLYIGLFVGMNLIGLTLLYFAFFGSKTENTPAKPQQVAPKNNKKS
jgi:serine/threonine protein kinase